MWKLGQVIISTTEDRRLYNINNLFPLLKKCICNAAPYGCDKKYCLSKGNAHTMLWNALFIYLFCIWVKCEEPWRSCGISLAWGLIPNCRGWLPASPTMTEFQLLSSQAPFGSFITPLSSGLTIMGCGGGGAPAKAKVQWHCCLRRLFYRGVTCFFNLSQQVPV